MCDAEVAQSPIVNRKPPMSLLWINGQLFDKADAKVSPFDHGFLYGDGVWEHFRVFGGKLFRPDDPISYLFSAAHNVGICVPFSQDKLRDAIDETVQANNRTEGYIRVIVTRGPGTLGPDPRKLVPQVIIIAEEYLPFPTELYAHGLNVVISEPGIWSVGWLPPLIRLLAHRHIVKAKADAIEKGCLEAVLLDDHGHVYGCTEGNLLRVLDGIIRPVTHYPFDVMRLVVEEMAGRLGIPFATFEKMDCGPTENHLLEAEEVFLAGTSCGVIGIVKVDDHTIGAGVEGPITRQLREAYRALTRGSE
jgi:branched-chain amino acid aminotransferase